MVSERAQFIAVKWMLERLKTLEAELKTSLGLRAGERVSADFGGFHLGFVTMARGRKTARVVNEAAFLAYVKARFPGEVEVVERVNPAFQKRLLDEAAKQGAFKDDDGITIDGIIQVTQGEPYPVVAKDPDLDISIAALVERNMLGINGLKELQ